ncbi:MAG: GNAT family N-acetyltransferase [Eubacteriales bacterium]|nr:GNAT family N-acetyltransferase [Eubacteriales bacterium]
MLTIRYADINDAKTLGGILAQSWRVAYQDIVPGEILDRFNAKYRQKCFEAQLIAGEEDYAVVLSDGQEAGFICIGACRDDDMDEECGEIWGMYLLPEYWRQGIGTALMRWGMDELKKRGYTKAVLWVLEENTGARRFYEKCGFACDGTAKSIEIGKKLIECRYVKGME